MNKEKNIEESWGKIEKGIGLFMTALLDSVKSWEDEQKINQELLNRNYTHVGKIIHYHLVIEYLINKALIVHLKKENKKLKLTFSQKLELLPKTGKFYCLLIPGIIQLNYIRNNISHDLDFVITDSDMEQIDKYMPLLKIKDISKIPIEKRIELFTNLCITLFSTSSPAVSRHWEKVLKVFPSLFTELEKYTPNYSLSKE